jgi:uncharacterized protein YsxB (DUF464 family)
MIKAVFTKSTTGYTGAKISGHAGYAERGADIVCASVTSAVQLTVNGITEVLGADMPVTVEENEIAFTLPENAEPSVRAFITALRLHLTTLAEEYGDYIEVSNAL